MTITYSYLRENAGLILHVVRPTKLSYAKLHDLSRLIEEGGQIRADGLADRLLRCRWVAYVCDGLVVVGTAALKTPEDGPDNNAIVKAQSPYNFYDFKIEIGFLMVATLYRGKRLASVLTKALCDKEPLSNIYATVAETNSIAQSILLKNRFIQSGIPFADRAGSGMLLLFVKISN